MTLSLIPPNPETFHVDDRILSSLPSSEIAAVEVKLMTLQLYTRHAVELLVSTSSGTR